ncbi:RidA family protein [Sediminibacterium goheungense]|uniref:Enamine deaminase RidA (YjgF/YER057c/UK114 family) n=1 Tax=Sediminibacterium goheungense TaxID=1086393 RepID=A0A4V3C583_9BACT|nr:RidA family protein [Sediminibacterium goheungense]TDO28718.1 enamine deaminase RidA (YjgF/YER057c/UK114 family) [Sediminibacterium goheungense]
MKAIILVVACLITFQLLSAQTNNIEKKKFHFGASQDTAAGYAQVVKADNVLYVSGTVATSITAASIERIYQTIEKSLNHFGASLQNVVKENLYTTDIEAMKAHNEVRKKMYKGDYPAATWVQISRLYMPEAKLEIEVIAHLPKEK